MMNQVTVGVLGILLRRSGDVLLLRTAYEPEHWRLPGGFVEPNESLVEALRREVHEELSLGTRIERLVGTYQKLHENNLNVIFFGESIGDILRLDAKEVSEARYFPLGSLPPNISPRQGRIIQLWATDRLASWVWSFASDTDAGVAVRLGAEGFVGPSGRSPQLG